MLLLVMPINSHPSAPAALSKARSFSLGPCWLRLIFRYSHAAVPLTPWPATWTSVHHASLSCILAENGKNSHERKTSGERRSESHEKDAPVQRNKASALLAQPITDKIDCGPEFIGAKFVECLFTLTSVSKVGREHAQVAQVLESKTSAHVLFD